MNNVQAALARNQLERRLAPLRAVPHAVPPKGWVKAIRESLGMTLRQLGARMGVAPSRVLRIERDEVIGATTLKTLRQAAEAMNCVFLYAFVPAESLESIVRDRAMKKAHEDISRLDHTMRLENQALLKPDLEAEQRRIAERLVAGSLRGLWDEHKAQN